MSKIRQFLCNVLGWHRPNAEIEDIGINRPFLVSHCKYCGKEIMRDSQGNWY